jgi:hypothetical protein
VVKDEVFGRINKMVDNAESFRHGFVTIPDDGSGTASGDNVYKWTNENPWGWYGCGFALSYNGELALSNPLDVGDDNCVPNGYNPDAGSHKGFMITAFLRDDFPEMAFDAQIDDPDYGRSSNFVPEKFRYGTPEGVDFDHWTFAPNNLEYVVGGLKGGEATVRGLFLIEWATNTWWLLSENSNSTAWNWPAFYYGREPGVVATLEEKKYSPEVANPHGYKIVSPNGGETFKVGDTLIVKVTANEDAPSDMSIIIDDLNEFKIPPGRIIAFNPLVEDSFSFVIPEYFIKETSATTADTFSTISDNIKIKLFQYPSSPDSYDLSEPFSIIANPDISVHNPKTASDKETFLISPASRCILNPSTSISIPAGASRLKLFTLDGKLLFNTSLNPRSNIASIDLPSHLANYKGVIVIDVK